LNIVWEGSGGAMGRALGSWRAWTTDTSRYAIELFSPSVYLSSSYYEKWFLRNVRLLVERGFIDEEEVAAGRALRPGKNLSRGGVTPADVEQVTPRGALGRAPPAPAPSQGGGAAR